ncbi:YgdI/YgdR family lipoprotein [Halopseudomonas sp.]|uniref:YgdI/YgdR family lipoprotein n=1 Tax=Halopseudomonas sp. TaxID=2901191 RepID=UPI001A3B3C7B|nr:YgdI/YgdR family lipoprotein [Pseudomonas sp.]
MKKSILASICALGMLTLVGCASDYLISTNDGRMIDSQDKPEIDEDTGMIMYEDEEGRENQIPQSDVKEIKER